MPALRMKNKPSGASSKETSALCICQKSYIITKKSSSNDEIIQESLDSDNCSQHSFTEANSEDSRHTEAMKSCQLLDETNSEIEQQLLFAVDSTPAGDMENRSPSQHDIETIFSPALEPSELSGSTCQLSLPVLDTDEIYVNRSSCDYDTCSISDFYISDVIIASLPAHGGAICKEDDNDDDAADLNSVDCRSGEPNLLLDVADHFMIVPFVGGALDDGITKSDDADTVGKENSSFYLAISQIRSGNPESQCNSEIEEAESFDPQLFIRTLPDLSDEVTSSESAPFRIDTEKRKSVTLVLDLDETLVHSTLDHRDDADFTFTVFFNMTEHKVYVKKRPYLQTFLERVADMFNVVVFTASQSIYAEQLLDILDPNQQLISHRVYRESCTFSDGTYTKDLTILGVDLAKVAIIDNSPQVFRLQVNNGIPIKSWFDDPSDCALISLLPFLETLAEVEDVRPIIARRFGNQE